MGGRYSHLTCLGLPLNCLPGTAFCNTLCWGRPWKWSTLPCSPPGALPFPSPKSRVNPVIPGGNSLRKQCALSAGETRRRRGAARKTRGGERRKEPWPKPTHTRAWLMFRQLCSFKGCRRTNVSAEHARVLQQCSLYQRVGGWNQRPLRAPQREINKFQ